MSSKFIGRRRSTEASIVLSSIEIAVQRLDAQGNPVGNEEDLARLVVDKEGQTVGLEFPGEDQVQAAPGFKLFVRERGRESRTTVTELLFEDEVSAPEPEEIPGAPRNLLAADVTRTSALLTWMPPEGDVPIHHYEVFLDGESAGMANGWEFPLVMTDPGDGLSHRLIGVRAVSNYGVGSFPATIQVPVPPREGEPEENGDPGPEEPTEPEQPGTPWPMIGEVGCKVPRNQLTRTRGRKITKAGTVIQNELIDTRDGGLEILARDVTIRNCHFLVGIWGVDAYTAATNLVVEDCSFEGGYQAGIGLAQAVGWRISRCDFFAGRDAIKPGGSGVVERCTMHDPATGGDAHNDCLQFSNCDGVVVRQNNLQGADTSCIAMFEGQATYRNVTVQDNFLTGAGYLIYAGGRTGSGIRVIDNVFGTSGWGPVTDWDGSRPGNEWSGNVTEGGTVVRP